MITRRNLLQLSAGAATTLFLPRLSAARFAKPMGPFRFCLNMSTISGQKPGLLQSIEIAAAAGYDGVELWIKDIQEWLTQGNSVQALATFIKKKNIRVENAISFTEWMSENDARRALALQTLEKEMRLMAALGCRRIAAPPVGVSEMIPLDTQKAGMHYREILYWEEKPG